MKPVMSKIQLVQVSFATLFIFSLLLHTLLYGNGNVINIPDFTHNLHDFFFKNLTISLCFSWCVVIGFYLYWSTRPNPVLILDYSCYKPDFDRKCSYEVCEYFVRRSKRFNSISEEFMRGIYLKSGLGDETYVPPFIFQNDYEATLKSAIDEAEQGMYGAVDSILFKTQVDPQSIDIVIVTCGSFTSIPSLSSVLVNKYKFKADVKTYNLTGMGCSSGVMSVDLAANLLRATTTIKNVLVVVTENISLNWYFGDNRSMLVTNCIFRVGCAAAIITNDPSRRNFAKMELVKSLRTHHGANDSAYNAAVQQEDEQATVGVSLTKDLIRVAAMGLKQHITLLAPRVLPLFQLISYAYSVLVSVLWTRDHDDTKPIIPDFTTAFDHMCIHTGGKAVINQVARVLRLTEDITEPARMTLHRFGNTSSSLVFYELAYYEAKGRLKKGDKTWMLAFGTGFKVCSLVVKSLRDSCKEPDNPWNDCIHRYPLKAW